MRFPKFTLSGTTMHKTERKIRALNLYLAIGITVFAILVIFLLVTLI